MQKKYNQPLDAGCIFFVQADIFFEKGVYELLPYMNTRRWQLWVYQ